MKVSTRGRYGMHMMQYIAYNKDQTPIPLSKIAEDLKLPEAYLEQLMRKLKKGGFVESQRGAYGGYSLAKPAEEIMVLDILNCLEGSIAPTDCSFDGFTECANSENCPIRPLWKRINEAVIEAVKGYNLADLIKDGELSFDGNYDLFRQCGDYKN